MKPQTGDVVITGKRGLDAFPGTNLEEKLKEHGTAFFPGSHVFLFGPIFSTGTWMISRRR